MANDLKDLLNNGGAAADTGSDSAADTDTATDNGADSGKDISQYEGHFALRGINKGNAKKLLGKVCLVAFFVHDIKCAWKKEETDIMKEVLVRAVDELKKQSGLSDNQLSLSYAFADVPVQLLFDRNNYYDIATEVLRQYGYKTTASYSEHYQKKFKKDEAPLVFFIHRDFRSFSLKHTDDSAQNYGEFAFVSYNYSIERCVRTLLHELLHQFGAIDYYLPPKVKEVAEKYFDYSIMNGGLNIDPLTRYIIGWDEEPDESVFSFLEETKDVTDEEIAEAHLKDNNNDWG